MSKPPSPPSDPFAEGALLGEQSFVNVREAKLKQSAQVEALEKRLSWLERATANMYVHMCTSAGVAVDPELMKAIKEDKPIKVTTKFAKSGALIITFEPVDQ